MRIRILLFPLIRIRIRIQLPKMMRVHTDPDPQHCSTLLQIHLPVHDSTPSTPPPPIAWFLPVTVCASALRQFNGKSWRHGSYRKRFASPPPLPPLRFSCFSGYKAWSVGWFSVNSCFLLARHFPLEVSTIYEAEEFKG